ncbi:cell division cycle-associated protein 7-like isoform X2 [Macadamia integrifolia]|uniref:cell division cycle-associated protein 7-like isoform X2 n=1 Tax=Macadamia integrifolia TaxID=60698 RepID=UPI001C4EA5F1|nr:cell division cycle-associated protein 7-like isoform X2 [Macadamia integrifolia]
MVILRKRGRTLEAPVNPKEAQNDKTQEKASGTQEQEGSGYEQFRDKRIKENMERMQKLGILDLSLKLKPVVPTPKRTSKNTPERSHPSLLLPSEPQRRSSRLQKVAPVSYSELYVHKKGKSRSLDDEETWVREGVKPEIYTEEHEKLLGTCETPWTLFVDGYGKDGKRIYDSIKGKSCHQCRQKTLGHHTHCSKCNLGQGQFCGDCLYMRYGENVLEANQNPNWICPVCRGICNCSLCRLSKGWVPTGSLYRKVSRSGYKSVAHYLIQIRRSQTNSEEHSAMELPVSAKRSIPFADLEEPSQKKPLDSDDGNHECSKPQFEDNNEATGKKVEVQTLDIKHDVNNSASEADSKLTVNPELATEVCHDGIGGRLSPLSNKDNDYNGCTKSTTGNNQDDDKFRVGKEDRDIFKGGNSDIALGSNQKPQMEHASPSELITAAFLEG